MNRILILLASLLVVGNVYALPPCPSSGVFHNCFGTEVDADGIKYVGEWKNDLPHGQGSFTIPNGNEYVGEFRNGFQHGEGTYTWADGKKYAGEWKDGKSHGQGTFTWPIGEKYAGEWKDGKKHGQGTTTYANGDKYVGEWKNNKRDGYGIGILANGRKYVGLWKDGKYHGHGTYTWANGNKYVGEWKNNKRDGQGTMTWANGNKYVGEWKDGKPNGQGTLTTPSFRYVGEFKDGKMHGQGTHKTAKGSKYVGKFKDNKAHGQGTLTKDGNKYVGEFKDGKRSGQGTQTNLDGHKYVGEWKDDNRYGHGTYTWADGSKYVGEFKDDKYHGQGAFTISDGTKYVGEFKDDRYHGQGTSDRPKLDWSAYQPFDEAIQKQINCFFEHPEWIEAVRKFDTITASGPEFIALHDKFYIEAVDKRNILREMASVDISNMFNDPPFRPLDFVEAFSLILERGMPSLSREQVEFAAIAALTLIVGAESDLERLDRTSITEFASEEEKQILRRLACLNDQKRKQVIDSGFLACLGAEGNFLERFGRYSYPAMDSLNMLLIDGRITFGKYSKERLSFFDQIMTLSTSNEVSGLGEFESNLKDYLVKRGLLDSKGEPVSKRTFSCAEGEVVDLPPCPTSGIFHNCFGTRTYSDGEYVGEWKDNKAHGQGTVATANGDKYIGEFKDNKMHGQGTYKYVGECKNNESHGHDAYADLDGKMEVDIKRSIDKQQQFSHEHVNVTIYNGVVLLTGEVPDPRWTDTIIDLAKSHERSRQVINRLELAGKTNMMSRLNDHRITARVKTAIATSAPAELSCIKVVTEKANVYLMGLVTPEEADIAVEATRRVTGVVRVIKVFEYL